MPKSVQIIRDHFDIIRNPQVKAKYPALYAEIRAQDKAGAKDNRYLLSDAAAAEHEAYMADESIKYLG